MNKINGIRPSEISPIQISRAVDRKTLKDTFKVKMENLKQSEIRTELERLYAKIEEMTEKLNEKLFLEDLVSYKRLVKEFLNISVKNSLVFFKENSLDRRGRHRIYSLVKKVDLELEALTKDFIDIESNRIHILGKIEQIRGMLMDILT